MMSVLAVAIFFLWQYLRFAALAGLAIILTMMAINIYLTTQIKKIQVSMNDCGNQNMKLEVCIFCFAI